MLHKTSKPIVLRKRASANAVSARPLKKSTKPVVAEVVVEPELTADQILYNTIAEKSFLAQHTELVTTQPKARAGAYGAAVANASMVVAKQGLAEYIDADNGKAGAYEQIFRSATLSGHALMQSTVQDTLKNLDPTKNVASEVANLTFYSQLSTYKPGTQDLTDTWSPALYNVIRSKMPWHQFNASSSPEVAQTRIWSAESLLAKYMHRVGLSYETVQGGDPEVFGNCVPTTKMPKKQDYGNSFVRDGLAFELHFTGQRCFNNIRSAVTDAVREFYNMSPGVMHKPYNHESSPRLTCSPVLEITPTIKEQVAESQLELGCNPSENVYNMQGDLDAGAKIPRRWAGGHMHFGLPPQCKNPQTVQRCVKNLDALAGLAEVAALGHMQDPERRKYYGLAGEYRTKPYGLEYRTLSNQMWCRGRWFYLIGEIARMAVKIGIDGLSVYELGFKATPEEIIEAINTTNQMQAREIWARNADWLFAIFASRHNIFSISTRLVFAMLFGEVWTSSTISAFDRQHMIYTHADDFWIPKDNVIAGGLNLGGWEHSMLNSRSYNSTRTDWVFASGVLSELYNISREAYQTKPALTL